MDASGTLICPICGYVNPSNVKLCLRCQAALQFETHRIAELEDTSENQPRWGEKNSGQVLLLYVHGMNEPIEIYLEEGLEIVLGRVDTSGTSLPPNIDFTPYGAIEKGISRRHALLTYQGAVLKVTDLESANHTFLNNQRLVPYQARIIRDGDELRLGHLVMTAQFSR
jgi:hypothetical protein